jgi:hypothetical protein
MANFYTILILATLALTACSRSKGKNSSSNDTTEFSPEMERAQGPVLDPTNSGQAPPACAGGEGQSEARTMFEAPIAQVCRSQEQTRRCQAGIWSDYVPNEYQYSSCVLDQDGDTVGDAEDCAPKDSAAWQVLNYSFRDQDRDGITIAADDSVCAGKTLPVGYSLAASGSDCDDAHAAIGGPRVFYRYSDFDSDGFWFRESESACTPSQGFAAAEVAKDLSLESPQTAARDDDADNDGSRTASDCAPSNNQLWQILAYTHRDQDGDTYGVASSGTVCSGASLPVSYRTDPGSGMDCHDGDAGLFINRSYAYRDQDGDSYTVSASGTVCSGASLPEGYRVAANGNDCDDQNAQMFALVIYTHRDRDGDGFRVTAPGNLCQGSNVLPAGYFTSASVVADNDDLSEATTWNAFSSLRSELQDGIDFNGDGDTDDSFTFNYIGNVKQWVNFMDGCDALNMTACSQNAYFVRSLVFDSSNCSYNNFGSWGTFSGQQVCTATDAQRLLATGDSAWPSFDGFIYGNNSWIANLRIYLPTTFHVGGVAGVLGQGATVRNLGFSGFVHGHTFVGGVAGKHLGNNWEISTDGVSHYIENVINVGTIVGSSAVGGLIGNIGDGRVFGVRRSANHGAVMADIGAGGLVAEDDGYARPENIYNVGPISVTAFGSGLGQFARTAWSYNAGSLTENASNPHSGNSYSIGQIKNVADGLFQYWLEGAATPDYGPQGEASSNPPYHQRLTTTQFRQQASFAGYDFSSVWAIDEGISFPWLRALEWAYGCQKEPAVPKPGTSCP